MTSSARTKTREYRVLEPAHPSLPHNTLGSAYNRRFILPHPDVIQNQRSEAIKASVKQKHLYDNLRAKLFDTARKADAQMSAAEIAAKIKALNEAKIKRFMELKSVLQAEEEIKRAVAEEMRKEEERRKVLEAERAKQLAIEKEKERERELAALQQLQQQQQEALLRQQAELERQKLLQTQQQQLQLQQAQQRMQYTSLLGLPMVPPPLQPTPPVMPEQDRFYYRPNPPRISQPSAHASIFGAGPVETTRETHTYHSRARGDSVPGYRGSYNRGFHPRGRGRSRR